MVTLKLYEYTGAPNVINKQLGEPSATLQGVLYDRTNVLQPVVKLERNTPTFNYVYIEPLSRFYFVSNVTIVDANFMLVTLQEDTLKTYETTILNAVATATKTATPNYDSNNTPVFDVRKQLQQLEFGGGFDETGSVIMVTIKGD